MKTLWMTILVLPGIVFSQAGRKQIVEGNQLYQEERYDEALNKYQDAKLQDPESPVIEYNMGAAQYKKNKYEEAVQQYNESMSSDDIMVQANSYYNIGNSLYRMGKLQESIMAYQKCLQLNPDDEDAKYNLEFVRKQLKDQANKQQNQQDQQQQKQQQQQQQQQEQQEQQEQDQEQQEQEQKQQQQQQEQQEKEQEQEQQQQPQPEEMSREDAERILQALEEDEDKMKDARKKKASGRIRVLKDW